jgi:hypothetical protein
MTTTPSLEVRERISLDASWRFAFRHPHNAAKDFGHATSHFSYLAKAGYADGPASKEFDDRDWREFDVPHDGPSSCRSTSAAVTATATRLFPGLRIVVEGPRGVTVVRQRD